MGVLGEVEDDDVRAAPPLSEGQQLPALVHAQRGAYTMAGSKKGEKAKEEKEDVVMEEEDEWETDDEVEEQLVFAGRYKETAGTSALFEVTGNGCDTDTVFSTAAEPLEYVCKTGRKLVLERVFLNEKQKVEK